MEMKMVIKNRLRRPSAGTVLGTLALVVATSGAAVAAIPDAGGVITTCFSKASGTWRPIESPAQQCKKDEQTLTLYSRGGADAAFLAKAAKAADADLLDGMDSSQFLTAGATVDADTLDTLDSSDFQRSGAAAGGDLTGTYPNPTIGAGKVTSATISDGSVTSSDLAGGAVTTGKFAAGATAPDADKLGGSIAALYLKQSFDGMVGHDLGTIEPGTCTTAPGDLAPDVQPNDVAVVAPLVLAQTVVVSATPAQGGFAITACNLGSVAVDPPATTFRVLVYS
jgi:hypothetical protein